MTEAIIDEAQLRIEARENYWIDERHAAYAEREHDIEGDPQNRPGDEEYYRDMGP